MLEKITRDRKRDTEGLIEMEGGREGETDGRANAGRETTADRYPAEVISKHGARVFPGFVFPSFPRSQLLDVCQAAQLVKSQRRGISETLRDVMKKKEAAAAKNKKIKK